MNNRYLTVRAQYTLDRSMRHLMIVCLKINRSEDLQTGTVLPDPTACVCEKRTNRRPPWRSCNKMKQQTLLSR